MERTATFLKSDKVGSGDRRVLDWDLIHGGPQGSRLGPYPGRLFGIPQLGFYQVQGLYSVYV